MEYITENHRKKAFVIMGEIAEHCGYLPKSKFYDDVIKPGYNKAYDTSFSLKPGVVTLDEYDMFMEFVLDIAIDVGAQLSGSPKDFFHDIDKYLILMIKNRTCCITGLPGADIHHTETVGMGMDRTEVDHSKIPRMALCREKHMECHSIGQSAFNERYHVHGVLCEFHNGAGYDEEPLTILAHQNIKIMRYNADKGLLGVQFKLSVPGCNDKGVIVYRMEQEEYAAMEGTPDPKQCFIDTVYGKREIVEM
jgi:hypothetical protein